MSAPSKKISHQIHRLAQEAGLVILGLGVIILSLALVSYSPEDPGWNGISQQAPANLMGFAGSWLADVLFSIFGWAAWLLPLSLVHLIFVLIRRPWQQDHWNTLLPTLKFLGLLLLLIGCSSLAAGTQLVSHLPYGQGGILGQSLANLVQPLLGKLGANLTFFVSLLLGFTLLTGWTWLQVMDELGYRIVRFGSGCARLFNPVQTYLTKLISENKPSFTSKQTASTQITPTRKPVEAATNLARQEPIFTSNTFTSEPKPEFNAAPPHNLDTTTSNTPAKAFVTLQDLQPSQVALSSSDLSGSVPSLSLLNAPQPQEEGFSATELQQLAEQIPQSLAEFGVSSEVVASHLGPVITQFELQLAAGVKSSRVAGLALDLARALCVPSLRVVEVLAGKSTLGIEIPNPNRRLISLQEVLNCPAFLQGSQHLPLALGLSIDGQPQVADLAKMPHLLVAGTTGSGKSVGINALLASLLLSLGPEDLRLILIDPKMLELSVYEGIPHLLAPVVTDMQDAAQALRWCVTEMDRRYQLMSAMGVRNLAGFNAKLKQATAAGSQVLNPLANPGQGAPVEVLEPLPYVVVVIDEFADLMLLVGKKVEELITRLAQKARAAGIHLVLATQRPSVDVITGLIKANIPTRMAFQVSSKIDSRTILDQSGAEQLLGNGDLLFLPTGMPQPLRIHGAFVADSEVHALVENWKQRGEPNYEPSLLEGADAAGDFGSFAAGGSDEQDELYDEAVAFVIETRRASASALQRRFKIGYNRAANLIETMEAAGLVSPLQSNGQRQLLIPE